MSFLLDPWSFWVDPLFGDVSMRYALFASLLAMASTALVGVWVVKRGFTFFAESLSHSILPGIAIAIIIGNGVFWGALSASIVFAVIISLIRRFSSLSRDISIGLPLVGMLSLALVITGEEGEHVDELEEYLFGSVVGLDSTDLLKQGLVVGFALVGVLVMHRSFMVSSHDRNLARLMNMQPGLTDLLVMVILAITIVGSFQVVGSLLVVAFVAAPAATASLLRKKVQHTMLVSLATGFAMVYLGLLISSHADTNPSATMALTAVGVFFLVLLCGFVFRRRHQLLKRPQIEKLAQKELV